MARRVWPSVTASIAVVSLSGCGFFSRPERPIWRTQAENACFARNLVTPSEFIVPTSEIDGPGICGMTRPLKVSALAGGKIGLDKTLVIDCPMIPALEGWLNDIVQPDAEARFGQKVATVNVFGAYSCRSVDNIAGARLSEHAFGNAVDVAGFSLADGRLVEFVRDWKMADTQEAAFLHEVHAAPVSISPPCSDRAQTSSTTITSISISPITARPTLVRVASANRRPPQAFCRLPPRPMGCRPHPRSRSRWISRVSATPMRLLSRRRL
jgi:hypothetical protein